MNTWEIVKVVMDNLKYPTGICFDDKRGMLLISDMRGHKLYWLDASSFENGEMSIDIIDSQNYKTIDQPMAVYAGFNGDILIADAGLNMVFRSIPEKEGWIPVVKDISYLGEQEKENINNPPLNFPAGVTMDNVGNIFVNDFFNNSIRNIDSEGVLSTVIGGHKRGYKDGVFNDAEIDGPYGVFWYNHILYFIDKANNAIRWCDFDSDSVHTMKIGDNEAQFNGPVAMDVDYDGNFYICEQKRLHYVECNTKNQAVLIDNEIWAKLMKTFQLEREIGYISGIALSQKGDIYWTDAEYGLVYWARCKIN